jgi:type II secretory pathway pseudopilin PulG
MVELMVVIGVIGVLAAATLPQAGSLMSKAKTAKSQGDVNNSYTALLSYYDTNGDYPRRWLYNRSYDLRNDLREYMSFKSWNSFLMDPWNRWQTYYYPSCYGIVGAFYSNGPNGTNQTWSCWWWRYRGFSGDDIGRQIRI